MCTGCAIAGRYPGWMSYPHDVEGPTPIGVGPDVFDVVVGWDDPVGKGEFVVTFPSSGTNDVMDWESPDLPNTTATTASLALGSSVVGSVGVALDKDWYRVNLVAGQTYSFSLDGYSVNHLVDTYLTLFDSAGTAVAGAFNDDGGPGLYSNFRFTATTSGTYYIEARGFGNNTGDYLLSMNSVVPVTGVTGGLPFFNYQQIATQLTNGYWVNTDRSPHRFGTTTVTYNIQNLTAEGQTLAVAALQAWADVLGLTFQATTGTAQINFDDNQNGAFANYVASGTTTTSSNVNVGLNWLSTYGTSLNSYSYQTYIHEVGHVLGLGHSGLYNNSADYPVNAYYANDSWQASIMSYFDQDENTYVNGTRGFALTPQIADILAVQTLYGAPVATRAGNTTYGFNTNAGAVYNFANYSQGNLPSLTLYDTGGNDTLDISGYSATQTVDLGPGMMSSVGGETNNIMTYFNTVIENVIGGSGIDNLYGNAVGNYLNGRNGSDQFYGGAGNDYLWGEAGSDGAYYVGSPWDFYISSDATYRYIYDSNQARGGTDVLFSVESIAFSGAYNATPYNLAGFGANPAYAWASAPYVVVANNTYQNVANWFGARDFEGGSVLGGIVYDTAGGGSLYNTVTNTTLASGTYHYVSAAEFAGLIYVGAGAALTYDAVYYSPYGSDGLFGNYPYMIAGTGFVG